MQALHADCERLRSQLERARQDAEGAEQLVAALRSEVEHAKEDVAGAKSMADERVRGIQEAAAASQQEAEVRFDWARNPHRSLRRPLRNAGLGTGPRAGGAGAGFRC